MAACRHPPSRPPAEVGDQLVTTRGGDLVQLRASGRVRAALGLRSIPGDVIYEGFSAVSWDGATRAWVQVDRRGPQSSWIVPLRVDGAHIRVGGAHFEGSDPDVSADGRRVAYSRLSTLRIRDIDSPTERSIDLRERYPVSKAWSPTGREIALVLQDETGPRSIALLDLASGRVQDLSPPLPAGGNVTSVAWLGERLVAAVCCERPGLTEGTVVDAHTGEAIFRPGIRCAPSGVGMGGNGTVVTQLIPMECSFRIRPDRSDPQALYVIDQDGHLSRIKAGTQTPISNGIADVA